MEKAARAMRYGDASDPDWGSYLTYDVDEHAEWMRAREAIEVDVASVRYEGVLWGMSTHDPSGFREDFDLFPLIQGGLDIAREGTFYVARDWFGHVRRYGKGLNASFLGECAAWHYKWEPGDARAVALFRRLRNAGQHLPEGEGMDWDGYRIMRCSGHLLLMHMLAVELSAVTR
jgi:hypothetical protein